MKMLRSPLALLLVALLLTLTACAKKTDPTPATTKVTLADVRKEAATAFDGTISSAQRRSAADEAMKLLLALLAQPDSTGIGEKDWTQPARPGVAGMVRPLDLGGGVHLYALALPGNTLVETRERLAVQVRKTGHDPVAMELPLLPDSKLVAARALKEGAKTLLTLALNLSAGGGYVAHFNAGADGQFQAASGAFAGLSGQYGSLTLSNRDHLLTISGPWAPAFDAKQPLRLVLGPEVALDWKQRFVLVDDSKFDAFALFKIAQDPYSCKGPDTCPESLLEKVKQSPKEAAKVAWAMATAKMTVLLQSEKSFTDDFVGKLPATTRNMREQGRDMTVRLLSLPAPEGVTPRAYTAVQWRAGGGLPMAKTLALDGQVEFYRVMTHEGLPALFLAVDVTKDEKGPQRSVALQLLRLNAGNDWIPADKWVGSIPVATQWNFGAVAPNSVTITWELAKASTFALSMTTGNEPALSICRSPQDCHQLTWVGGKLHSLPVLRTQLKESTAQGLPADQVMWRASQLAQFLSVVDPATVGGAQLLAQLDPDRSLGMKSFDAGMGVRVVTMPPNPGPVQGAVAHAKGVAVVVRANDSAVTTWEGARVYQGGSGQRLVVVGRSTKGVVLVTYQFDGATLTPVDALDTKVDQMLSETARLINNPGSDQPVRGLLAWGTGVNATLNPDGVRICDVALACVTYGYDGGWKLLKK